MTTGAGVDRIEGVLLGGACGDALGVPYEFGSAPLGPGEVPRMVGGGLGPYAPGEWSDDTQMAAVTARVAADRGLSDATDLDAVVEGWIEWLHDGATDVGSQTRQVLGAVAARPAERGAQRAREAARELHRRTGRTAGNGSLMRTAPVALAFLHDPAALTTVARAVSDLTHADPLAGDACVIWCHAIRLAVLEGTMPDLAELVTALPVQRRDRWAGWIAEAQARPPWDFAPNGFVVTALQAAWSAIHHPIGDGGPLVASLTSAVHAGDDTDTVAAIAGSLLGAVHGASALPQEWLADVHGWPGLRADDLRDLALRVAGRGASHAEETRVLVGAAGELMGLPEPGLFAVCESRTYQVASAAADTVTLRVPRASGPLPDHLEGGVRRDGDHGARVRKASLERYFTRHVTVRWQGEELGLGRVAGDTAEIHHGSPTVARRLGLEGDQYNGFRATVPVEELTVVDVREREIDL